MLDKQFKETFDEMVDDTFKRTELSMQDIYKPPRDFFIKHDIFVTKPVGGGYYTLEITPMGKKLQSKILLSEQHKKIIDTIKNNK